MYPSPPSKPFLLVKLAVYSIVILSLCRMSGSVVAFGQQACPCRECLIAASPSAHVDRRGAGQTRCRAAADPKPVTGRRLSAAKSLRAGRSPHSRSKVAEQPQTRNRPPITFNKLLRVGRSAFNGPAGQCRGAGSIFSCVRIADTTPGRAVHPGGGTLVAPPPRERVPGVVLLYYPFARVAHSGGRCSRPARARASSRPRCAHREKFAVRP